MEYINESQLAELFEGAAAIFAEKKAELCEMDAHMGDGDLGLTMCKGFGALPGLLLEHSEPGNIGKTLMKAGMKMAGLVPSTMGTLMASGIMEGGKEIGQTAQIGSKELSDFLTGFAAGIQKRGKCQLGDCTILDAADAAAKCAAQAYADGKDIARVMQAAIQGATAGVESTKDMIPKYGKAAVFSAKAKGIPDQGAVAERYLLEGLGRFFVRD